MDEEKKSVDQTALFEKLQALKEKIAKTGLIDQIAEVQRIEDAIKRNYQLKDLQNDPGMKELIAIVKLEQSMAYRDIFNRKEYFTDKESYLEKLDMAWRKIEQTDFFLRAMTGADDTLSEYDRFLDYQLKP